MWPAIASFVHCWIIPCTAIEMITFVHREWISCVMTYIYIEHYSYTIYSVIKARISREEEKIFSLLYTCKIKRRKEKLRHSQFPAYPGRATEDNNSPKGPRLYFIFFFLFCLLLCSSRYGRFSLSIDCGSLIWDQFVIDILKRI